MHILTQKGWMYMDHVDNATVQRVWQRVKAPSTQTQPASDRSGQLSERILEEWQTLRRYMALQGQAEYRNNPELKNMIEQKQTQLACLKGIYRLSANAPCKIPAVAPKQEPPAVMLRKCYGSLLRCGGVYGSAMGQPEYGGTYGLLAEQNRRQAYTILAFLGGIK